MKKSIALLLAVLSVFVFISGCGSSNTGETNTSNISSTSDDEKAVTNSSSEPITFTVALTSSEDHQFSIAMKMLNDILVEKTDGRIQLELFYNGALGGDREATEGVIMGSIDMTMVATDGAVPAWVPDTAVMSIPYLFASREEAHDTLDNYIMPRLSGDFEEAGMKLLGIGEQGFRHFTNNKRPIKSASDMEGLIIRVQEAPVWFALCDAVGATAQPVSFNELYTALQQGVVDGQENPLGTIVSSKLYEVQKYICLDGHTYGSGVIIMNLDRWNSLSEEDKKIFEEAVAEMLPEQRELIAQMDEENLQYLLDIGAEVETNADIESFQKATEGMEDLESVKALFDDVTIVQGVRDYINGKA